MDGSGDPVVWVLAGGFVADVAEDVGVVQVLDAVEVCVAEAVGDHDEVAAVGECADPEAALAFAADRAGPDATAGGGGPGRDE